MILNVDFELASQSIKLGETVTGKFICQGIDRKLGAVDISINWYTRGKGIQDRQTVRSQIFNVIEPDIIMPFSLELPTNAPPTYEGKLIRIVWEVKMTVYVNGFLGRFGNQKQEYFASINVLPSQCLR
jgi:hypothetical protein